MAFNAANKKKSDNESALFTKISNEYLKRFTKLTMGNILEMFNSNVLYIVIERDVKKDSLLIRHQFNNVINTIKGNSYSVEYMHDGKLRLNTFVSKEGIRDEFYQELLEDNRSILRMYIKQGNIYVKKIGECFHVNKLKEIAKIDEINQIIDVGDTQYDEIEDEYKASAIKLMECGYSLQKYIE